MTVSELIDLLKTIDCPDAEVFACESYQDGDEFRIQGIMFSGQKVQLNNLAPEDQ